MTEDILDLDKLRKQFSGWEQVQRLIQEVEELRSELAIAQNLNRFKFRGEQDETLKKEIDSLTKERDELKEALMHENKQLETATIKHLKAQLSESQKRVKELEEYKLKSKGLWP